MAQPGLIAFMGSGETATLGGQVYDLLVREFEQPIFAAVLETPAGFELNSPQVAGRVAEYIARRLQNLHPRIDVIPARRKGSRYSPDEAEIAEPLNQADLIFLGPGSPTYAVRQLANSLTWQILRARHGLGSAVAFASAAVVAAGKLALPVYEIYKAGMDPFWTPGLDFLGFYGLNVVFIPHWNNTDGGVELDTSHCFMGQERFDQMYTLLEQDITLIGIDEHTALILDPCSGKAEVLGGGAVHVLRNKSAKEFYKGAQFDIGEIGEIHIPPPDAGIDPNIFKRAQKANSSTEAYTTDLPKRIQELVEARETARQARNWSAADQMRSEINKLGWTIKDTPEGAIVEQLK